MLLMDVVSNPGMSRPYYSTPTSFGVDDLFRVFVFLVIVATLLFCVRLLFIKTRIQEKEELIRRVYFFVVSFFLQLLLFVSLAHLFVILIGLLIEDTQITRGFPSVFYLITGGAVGGYGSSYQAVIKLLTSEVSLILVAVPLFAFHVVKAFEAFSADLILVGMYKAFRACYLWIVLATHTLILLIFGVIIINHALQLLLDVPDQNILGFVKYFGILIASLAIFLVHAYLLKKTNKFN